MRIVTRAPRSLPGPARVLDRIHVRSVPSTVRRELLFAAGDAVDSLEVATSMRRLRNLGIFEDAWLTATRCDAGDGGDAPVVDLVVHSRDVWSTIPEGNWTPLQQTLGIHETNLLGTGRRLSAVLRWDANRLGDSYRFGGQLALSDPALTPRIAAGAGVVAFVDGHAWSVAAGTRPRTLADRWTARGDVSRSLRTPADVEGEQVRRERAATLVGRRLSPERAGTAAYLLGGVELERAHLAAPEGALVVGPRNVRRSFAGPTVGAALRAVRFDTLTWLLPRNGLADIPRGTELEVVVGGGRDVDARSAAGRIDGWVGRVWRPEARSLVATDLWAWGAVSGAGAGRRERARTGSVRAAVTAFRGTGDGLWTARAGAERRVRPDPDLRPYVGLDPTATLVAGDLRLALATAVASLERSTHVRPVTRTLVLDAAVFGAASRRWRPASSRAGNAVTLGLVGVGLRLAPTRPGQVTAGLDFGFPLGGPPGAGRGPVARVLIAPWFGSLRRR